MVSDMFHFASPVFYGSRYFWKYHRVYENPVISLYDSS